MILRVISVAWNNTRDHELLNLLEWPVYTNDVQGNHIFYENYLNRSGDHALSLI